MSTNGRSILPLHAAALMTLTPILTCATYIGGYSGLGPYGGLVGKVMAIVGLVKDYLLMGLGVWGVLKARAVFEAVLAPIALHRRESTANFERHAKDCRI